MNTSKPTGGENPPKKEPPTGKTQVQQENPHKQEKRATLQHPDKEIKETTPLNPTEPLPQKFTPQRQLAKQSIRNCRKNQKDSPKMGRQRKNMQSKGMEESPEKGLNEMEASKLSDIEGKRMVIRILKELTDN